jgi:hypothetical protein
VADVDCGRKCDQGKGEHIANRPVPHPHPVISSPTEMTTFPRFRLKIAPRAPEMPEAIAGPSAPPTVQRLDLRVQDPATSRSPGSFNYDRESGK